MVPTLHQKALLYWELALQTRPRQIQAILQDALVEAESAVRNEKLQVDPAPEPATAEGPNVKRFPSQLTGQDAILNDGRLLICVLQFGCRQFRCRQWRELLGRPDGFETMGERGVVSASGGHQFNVIFIV